jgi:acetyl-CoA synthetase
MSSELQWQVISTTILTKRHPFALHQYIFDCLFPNWRLHPETAPVYIPTDHDKATANITALMRENGIDHVKQFHRLTADNRFEFWQTMISKLGIVFKTKPTAICDLTNGIESPHWLPGSTLNITDSCFRTNADKTAILYEDNQKNLCRVSYGELERLSNRIANSLLSRGFNTDCAIAIIMPMTMYAVAIYLAIIKIGGVVVSIADSFSSLEIAMRLKIAKATAVFTQDTISWGGKTLPLFEKITEATQHPIIVLPNNHLLSITLRDQDVAWDDFLLQDDTTVSVPCEPMAACNILFSSGTTAEPKAIAWNHTTPIKVASDAYLHQNIKTGDVLAWPTNLGWMMGPWLVFAALMNHATIALFPDIPKGAAFGEFVQNAKVTMLGVVPTLVAYWHQTACMEPFDWSHIKVFSSTGECSNPDDMFYLMYLGGYKPVIEYCGGTEIGGAYLSSTVIENNYPSVFTTPAMGLDIHILDNSEVAIIPPSIGLSTDLLNADHHHIYYDGMPTLDGKTLRRHGDQVKRLPNGCFSIMGRADDTMNLGGIKVSAAEIERTLVGIPGITETAAIAIKAGQHGADQLVIYAVTQPSLDKELLRQTMQARINAELNPLFKIHEVILTTELPKTASNKIMRRMLRDRH